MVDGDDIGGWLRGENLPTLGVIMSETVQDKMERELIPQHRDIAEYRRRLPRPLSPALHAEISLAQSNFALFGVSGEVAESAGEVVYAGGDEGLVFLPARSSLQTACALRKLFRSHAYMGPKATLSAGVAVVHYQQDLRFALQQAREALAGAKHRGREKDMLEVRVCRRAGEHARLLCPWEHVSQFQQLVEAFGGAEKSASDRWVYGLGREWATLAGIAGDGESGPLLAEVERIVNRAEERTREVLGKARGLQFPACDDDEKPNVGRAVADWCQGFRDSFVNKMEPAADGLPLAAEAYRDWLQLCFTASFLARGGD